jgi:hypothetical protein
VLANPPIVGKGPVTLVDLIKTRWGYERRKKNILQDLMSQLSRGALKSGHDEVPAKSVSDDVGEWLREEEPGIQARDVLWLLRIVNCCGTLDEETDYQSTQPKLGCTRIERSRRKPQVESTQKFSLQRHSVFMYNS